MAASGYKISGLPGSFSRDSAEDFEHSCDPCLTEGQHVEASGYCIDCCEYLCVSCFRYHKKTRALSNHQLLDKDNMHKHSALPKPTDICTEKCSTHRNEVIKYFCPKHEELGCTDCMTMKHRICKLDYIPEKCSGIGKSNEYRDIVKQLDQKLREADVILKKASVKDKEIDDSHDRAIKDFVKFRKELNDHLDTIQKKMERKTSKKVATCKQEVKAVITSCTEYSSNIKKMKSSLQNSKAANQNGQLFTDIKRAKSELQSEEIEQAAASLEKTGTQFTFTRNKDLEDILAVGKFGTLTEKMEAIKEATRTMKSLAVAPKEPSSVATLSRQGRTGMFSSLQHQADIDLGSNCHISGCVVLSSGKLVLADCRDSRLLVVNTERNIVIERNLDSNPFDIALLPREQIAVTMTNQKQILIMTTAREMSTVHSINVKRACYGIIYHQNCLYVLCKNPDSIHVLDMKGNIKNTISLDKAGFNTQGYMVLSQDHSRVYISDYNNDSTVSVTLQGDVCAVYEHKNLDGPNGMLVLDDGSLLVCSSNDEAIHHVSADLKQDRQVLDGFFCPQCLCYSADRRKVYIGCYGDDKLAVCSVTYKKYKKEYS